VVIPEFVVHHWCSRRCTTRARSSSRAGCCSAPTR
jgi:hypothetical protein